MFIGRFVGVYQRAFTRVAKALRRRRHAALLAETAAAKHGGSVVASASVLSWRLLCMLVPTRDVSAVRAEAATEYVLRAVTFFSSLLTVIFMNVYW
jgi:hypothetical protein